MSSYTHCSQNPFLLLVLLLSPYLLLHKTSLRNAVSEPSLASRGPPLGSELGRSWPSQLDCRLPESSFQEHSLSHPSFIHLRNTEHLPCASLWTFEGEQAQLGPSPRGSTLGCLHASPVNQVIKRCSLTCRELCEARRTDGLALPSQVPGGDCYYRPPFAKEET